jgi:tetratricopeptide (TPR) repeat protein
MQDQSSRLERNRAPLTLPSAAVAVLLAAALSLPAPGSAAVQADGASKPDPAASDIENGIRLFRSKDAAGAKVQFNAAVKLNPQSADARTWRGIAENQLQQYREAAQDFQAALRIDPGELSAHYNLALTFIRLEETDKAIAELRTVTTAHPGVVEPEYNLAILLEAKKAIAEAAEHLQAAYQTDPSDIGVAQHLLVDFLVLGKKNQAQPIFDQIQSSSSPEKRRQIATALIEAEQFQPAMLLLEDSADQTARTHESDLLVARAYIGAQEYEKAISLLQPKEPADKTGQSAYLLGLAYSGKGAADAARGAFERAVNADPRNGPALYHLGLIESGVPDEQASAARHLRAAIRLEPRNPVYTLALGRILLQQDHAQDAIGVLQSAQLEGPIAGERDLLLGIAQVSAKSASQAMPTLERSVAEDPSLPLSHNILGFCYFQQGDYAKGAEAYSRASDMRPGVGIFAHDAAIAFERSNQSDKALIYASRAVALAGATGDDHYLIGKLLAKAGHKDEAIGELKEAVALSPDIDAPYYLLARTYMQKGDATQANEWNAKLIALKQQHDRAYAASKNSKPVTSSTLLKGAPMTSSEADLP